MRRHVHGETTRNDLLKPSPNLAIKLRVPLQHVDGRQYAGRYTYTGSRCGLAATIRNANKFRWSRAKRQTSVDLVTSRISSPNIGIGKRRRGTGPGRGRGVEDEGKGGGARLVPVGGGGGEAKRSRPEKEDKKKQAKAKSAQGDRVTGDPPSDPPRGIRGMGWEGTPICNATLTHNLGYLSGEKKRTKWAPLSERTFSQIYS